MEYSERILSADAAKAMAGTLNFEKTVLTYVLWDRSISEPQPIYVGTAKTKGRIDNHARKANGGTSLTRKSRAIEFAEYVERRAKNAGPEWLGISLHKHDCFEEAKITERDLIKEWGIRKDGGKLFNRQMNG